MNKESGVVRICKECCEEKLLSLMFFPTAGKINGKQYFRWKCVGCYGKEKNKKRKEKIDQIHKYKKTLVCQTCGYSDYRALEFHHTDPKQKESTIAEMLHQGFDLQAIEKEIKKCVCLCVNCHRILHYEEKRKVDVTQK